MITLDYKKCTECGICLTYLGGYCINEREGRLEIDYTICNECQKCIAVCPNMVYMNNNTLPKRIKKPLPINDAENLNNGIFKKAYKCMQAAHLFGFSI